MENNILKVVFILLGAILANRIVKRFAENLLKKALTFDDGLSKMDKEREATISKVFANTLGIFIWIAAVLMVLPEIGINISALLAGIGVVGLAIGMGSRKVIQDYIAGLFIVLEDHYRVGDKVEIAGVSGKVVDLNFRTTILKDTKGKKYIIPNSEIKISSKGGK